MRRFAAAFVVGLVLLPVTALAEVTQAELADARNTANEIAAELDDELVALDRVLIRKQDFESRIERIERELADRDRQIALAAFAVRDQARAMYVSAGTTQLQAVASPEGITRLGTKTAYLDAVVDLDVDVVNQLAFLQDDRQQLTVEFERLVEENKALAAEIEDTVEEIMGRLSIANAEYTGLYEQWQIEEAERIRLAEEERRRQEAAAAAAAAAETGYSSSAGTPTRGRTCPVAGASSFRDSWGEPRYPNRQHHGVDMIAPQGTPLVSIETGYVWSPNWHWAGGIGLYIRGDSGDIYYYAHLERYANGIVDGLRVNKGQTVGYVGNTGNSSVPHLHLGYQPGGGPLTNPYQLMVKLCR